MGDDAHTIAKFLQSESLQERARGSLIWMDEAGLVGSEDMKAVIDFCDKHDARLLMTGDRNQHKSVSRGDAFRVLIKYGGIEPSEVRTIIRQKDNPELKAAIYDISIGHVEQGFEKLDSIGAIKEIRDHKRDQELADAYMQATEKKAANAKAETCLVVSPTHSEGERITNIIRERLKERGDIKHARSGSRLKSLSFTKEQASNPVMYDPGQVVVVNTKVSGKKFAGISLGDSDIETLPPKQQAGRGRPAFRGHNQKHMEAGTKITVLARHKNGLVLGQTEDGKKCLVPTWEGSKLSVYEKKEFDVGVGDRIRITRNANIDDHRLINGKLYTVGKIAKNGDITLKENGWKLPRNFGHYDHGYRATSVTSQGSTVDSVIIAQSGESLGAASSREQFYVSVSRARKNVQVFTDNKEYLLESVLGSSERLAAIELAEMEKERQEKADRHDAEFALVKRNLNHFASVYADAMGRVIGKAANISKEAIDRGRDIVLAEIDARADTAPINSELIEQASKMAKGLVEHNIKKGIETVRSEENENLSMSEVLAEADKIGAAFRHTIDTADMQPLPEKTKSGPGRFINDDPDKGMGAGIAEAIEKAKKRPKQRLDEIRRKAQESKDSSPYAKRFLSVKYDIRQQQLEERKQDKAAKQARIAKDLIAQLRGDE